MKPGYSNTNSYLTSAWPWVTSSVSFQTSSNFCLAVEFPLVSSWIKIRNDSTGSLGLRVQFVEPTTVLALPGNPFWTIPPGETIEVDLRVRDIFLLPHPITTGQLTASIFAGLTGIPRNDAPDFTTDADFSWMNP